MAIALRRIRDRVRSRIRDTDARESTFSPLEVDQAICEAYLSLQARLPAAKLYTASALTIAAGGDTFALSTAVTQWTGNDGGAEYAGEIEIQLTSTGDSLVRKTNEQMDALRNGQPTVQLAIPWAFTLWEEKDQTVQGRCYPGARDAQACNIFRALSADDLRDFVGSGAQGMDEVKVQMSRIAANALVIRTSADLVGRMDAAALAKRKLNAGVVKLWLKEANDGLYQEIARRNDAEELGETQRWAS